MDNNIMTPKQWAAKERGLNITGADIMQQYAEYYAREVSVNFDAWLNRRRVLMPTSYEFYDRFIKEQKRAAINQDAAQLD